MNTYAEAFAAMIGLGLGVTFIQVTKGHFSLDWLLGIAGSLCASHIMFLLPVILFVGCLLKYTETHIEILLDYNRGWLLAHCFGCFTLFLAWVDLFVFGVWWAIAY